MKAADVHKLAAEAQAGLGLEGEASLRLIGDLICRVACAVREEERERCRRHVRHALSSVEAGLE